MRTIPGAKDLAVPALLGEGNQDSGPGFHRFDQMGTSTTESPSKPCTLYLLVHGVLKSMHSVSLQICVGCLLGLRPALGTGDSAGSKWIWTTFLGMQIMKEKTRLIMSNGDECWKGKKKRWSRKG